VAAQPILENSLGILALAGYTELIPAGQTLPVSCSRTFANAQDDQPGLTITLAQQQAGQRRQIAEATIENLPPRPRGTLFVSITLFIDAQKQLRVRTVIEETGLTQEVGTFPVR
jgi:molecular chaperone DnaK (HSP70)